MKCAIARQGGMAELNWDGFIKVIQKDKDKLEERERTWLKRQQSEFAKHLQHRDTGVGLTTRS